MGTENLKEDEKSKSDSESEQEREQGISTGVLPCCRGMLGVGWHSDVVFRCFSLVFFVFLTRCWG